MNGDRYKIEPKKERHFHGHPLFSDLGTSIRDLLTRKKKSVKLHTWGGGQNWVISTLFFIFFSFMS